MDRDILHEHAQLASLAYQGETTVKEALPLIWYKFVAYIKRGNAACFIAEKDGVAYVVFRGTDDFKDWIANVSILPAKESGCKCPKGFVNELNDLWSRIDSEIKQHKFPAVYFIGHSLGGAMAVIAALRIKRDVEGITTFGQPRCCCKLARERFKSVPIHRVVNCDDKVPKAPPVLFSKYRLINPYRHVCKPIYINRKGDLVENASAGYIFWDGLRRFSLAKPHYRQSYVDVLA